VAHFSLLFSLLFLYRLQVEVRMREERAVNIHMFALSGLFF
jgi:hypothetical protein